MYSYQQVRKLSFSINKCNKIQESVKFANEKKLIFESGTYAKLADGAIVASVGATSVLVAAVSKARSGGPLLGFMPLTVDYRQKYVAAGRIPSNYFRRELAPTEKEILTSRVIDRSIRPLFPKGFYNDTQLTCQLLAVDSLQDPDVISINAASAALAISNIPWDGPIGAVRVGFIDGEVVTFPDRRELSKSSLNLIITASQNSNIVMLEGSGAPVLLQDLKTAIQFGVQECQKIINSILNLAKGITKQPFESVTEVSEELLDATRSFSGNRIREILMDFSHNKLSRDNAINKLRHDVGSKLSESFPHFNSHDFNTSFSQITKEIFRNLILQENIRCDGRSLSDLRPVSCAVDLFKPLHGSSLFQRGQTQVQCTVAYDSPEKALKMDPLLQATGASKDRNFFLHYSFPSFANNELPKGSLGLSRREVGHGALAAKALAPLIPNDFPFTVLLSATVMESNGSSSMATVCGGSLALMDAGVDITSPAAGVAMGLICNLDEENRVAEYKILTDILGIEDYLGDMDFKIAGTITGLTAIQADVKLTGIPLKIIMEALNKSYEAKNELLNIMNEVLPSARKDKDNLPMIVTREIPPHKKGRVLGTGGINIRKLQAETGVQFTWTDNTTVSIFAPNQESLKEVMQFIDEQMEEEPELDFGAIYTAVIKEIIPQGVMVSLYDGMTPTLLHNSQLDVQKVQHASVLNFEIGQEIKVKYFGRDPTSGRIRLSRRALLSTVAPPGTRNLFKQN